MLTQMHMDVRRHTQTHADERKANCVQCVGGRNLKTHQDVRRLFKDFQDNYTFKFYFQAHAQCAHACPTCIPAWLVSGIVLPQH